MGNLLRNNNPKLSIREVTDLIVRKNFENLQSYFNAENQLLGFKFIEVIFTAAQTNYRVKHGLPAIPQDIIPSLITGPGGITFNLGKFSATEIDITATGPCRVRFFAGTYWDSVPKAFASTDVIQVSAPVVSSDGSTSSSGSSPTGALLAYGGETAPAGFLLCDGAAYETADYPALFAVIGYSFGKPGPGQFNVPDARGYFLRGRANGSTKDPDRATRTAASSGGNTGDKVGSVQAYAVEAHTHGFKQTNKNFQTNDQSAIIALSPIAPTFFASSYGGNETRPLNLYVNYIIKT